MAGPYLRSHANEIVAALVVSPRGSGTAAAPGLAASEIGQRWSSGLALTNRRLLTLDLAVSMMGGVKEVKGTLSEVPLELVDGMKSKWNVLTVDAGGGKFKLECKPPAAKAMVRTFEAERAVA